VNSFTKITIPDALLQTARKAFPSTGNDLTLEVDTSDVASDQVTTDLDASLVESGYTFALPGATKPTRAGNYYAGAYTKSGSPDMVIRVIDKTALADFMKATGADEATQQAVISAVGTKKTIVFIIGGTGIVSSMPAANGTPDSATTSAATTGSVDIPVYSGATIITLPDAVATQFASSVGSVKNAKVVAYKVTDSDIQVKDFFTSNLTASGWLDISSQLPATVTAPLAATGIMLVGPFVKNPQIVVVMVIKGSTLTGASAIAGVSASDNVYIVLSGNT
jgi:hypothetical protein